MQPEALRIWNKLMAEASRFLGATIRAENDLERQLVVGEFCATIDTVGNTSNPVMMNASVGWSISVYQLYDVDDTFRQPVTLRVESTSEGAWIRPDGERWSDEEIVEWVLHTLKEWVRTNGRLADGESDSY